jgi:hypothetical protein
VRSIHRFVATGLALASATTTAAQQPLERLFYYVDTEQSYNSLVKHIDQITVLGPQIYGDSLGIVWGSIDRRVMDLASARRQVMLLVVNEGHGHAAALLADTAAAAARRVRRPAATTASGASSSTSRT